MSTHKGNPIVDTIMLVFANALAWLWDHIVPHITGLSTINFGKVHDFLASIFTLLSILYLLYRWRKDSKHKDYDS